MVSVTDDDDDDDDDGVSVDGVDVDDDDVVVVLPLPFTLLTTLCAPPPLPSTIPLHSANDPTSIQLPTILLPSPPPLLPQITSTPISPLISTH